MTRPKRFNKRAGNTEGLASQAHWRHEHPCTLFLKNILSFRGDSYNPGFSHFCVRQFVYSICTCSASSLLLCILFLFIRLFIKAGRKGCQDVVRMRDEKKHYMNCRTQKLWNHGVYVDLFWDSIYVQCRRCKKEIYIQIPQFLGMFFFIFCSQIRNMYYLCLKEISSS